MPNRTISLRLVLSITAVAAFLHNGASAASLNILTGEVLVNQGQGFVVGKQGMQLQPGDSVMAYNGGAGQIVLPSGQKIEIQQGLIEVVRDDYAGDLTLSAEGAGASLIPGQVAASTGVGVGISTGGAIIAGGSVAAATVAVLILKNKLVAKSNPASP